MDGGFIERELSQQRLLCVGIARFQFSQFGAIVFELHAVARN